MSFYYFNNIVLYILWFISFLKGEFKMMILLFVAFIFYKEIGAKRKQIGGREND